MGSSRILRPTTICPSSMAMMLAVMMMFGAMQVAAHPKVFNVLHYGAVPDAKTDNSKAFARAWSEACAWELGKAEVFIPRGTFMSGPVTFEGPCKMPIVLQVQGVVLAPTNLGVFNNKNWLSFINLDGLTITGHGKFHGQGTETWQENQCRRNNQCTALPTSIWMGFVNNTVVQRISSVESKMFHFTLYRCNNVLIRKVKIRASKKSPNTDGIHVGLSTNVTVSSSKIGTGDDCISVGPGSSNIYISKVFCGPGHGISVGSLGRMKDDTDVTNLRVTNCTFTRTTNGVRIKTWQDSYSLSASNFTFDNLLMQDVFNPIIIDQEYCPMGGCSNQAPSKVKISNIKFRNIRGTSKSDVAVNLKCSKAVPCKGVELNNIHLSYNGEKPDVVARAACLNVVGSSLGTIIPPPCI